VLTYAGAGVDSAWEQKNAPKPRRLPHVSLHAKVPDHLECDDARQGSVQADGHSLRRTGFPLKVVLLLTFKTVAARFVGQFFGLANY